MEGFEGVFSEDGDEISDVISEEKKKEIFMEERIKLPFYQSILSALKDSKKPLTLFEIGRKVERDEITEEEVYERFFNPLQRLRKYGIVEKHFNDDTSIPPTYELR